MNILILNAGIFWCEYEKTADGFEKTFQTNYLGHFYLIKKLRHLLFSSAPSRIIFVSAESHRSNQRMFFIKSVYIIFSHLLHMIFMRRVTKTKHQTFITNLLENFTLLQIIYFK